MDSASLRIAITKEQLAQLPTVGFSGVITVVDTPDVVAGAVELLRAHQVVGFDTETKPTFKKGMTNKVSLIQLSTPDHAFLFRLNKIGFPDELRAFMESDDVIKVGLSIKDDFHVLNRVGQFQPKSFVDLQELVKKFHITDLSLQKIYGIIFGGRISKSQRLTNWEAAELTTAQQIYASIDAWACLRIYTLLSTGGFDPSESPYIVKPEEEEQPQPHQQHT